MGKRKKPEAVTLEDLDGVASKRVGFLRTDARAAIAPTAASKTKLKEHFSSELEPQWVAASAELTATVLRRLSVECVAGARVEGGRARAGVRLGRNAVGRGLRQGALRAALLAQDAGPPLLYAHLAVHAQTQRSPVALLACSSAQLGQPFGLLRVSAVGLTADSFSEDHALVQLVQRAAGTAPPLPWLDAARSAAGTHCATMSAPVGEPT